MSSARMDENAPLWGENAPFSAMGGLLVLGVVASGLSVHFGLDVRGDSASPASAPSALALLPAPPSPVQASVSAAPPAPTPDCPPLFAVTFERSSDVPVLDSSRVAELVRWFASHPGATLVVDGHADALGKAEDNLELSRRRAKAVAGELVRAQLPASRITQRALGNYAPLIGTPEESPLNRRVVLSVAGHPACSQSEVP